MRTTRSKTANKQVAEGQANHESDYFGLNSINTALPEADCQDRKAEIA